MRHLRYVLVALVIGAWAAGPLPSAVAQTAPTYQSSDPSKGEMLDHPPAEVTVTFDQPLDESSWMNVLDECGREIDGGAATVNLNELTVQIGDRTPSGMYEVVYKAVGVAGATGSSGSTFEFMVHHGQSCAGGKKPHHGGGKKNDGHGNHDDNRKDDDGHGDHDDQDDGMDDHSEHSGMTGMGSSGHTGHTTRPAGHEAGGQHGAGHGQHGRHGGSPEEPGNGTEPPPLATGGTNVPVGADGQAVLLGLGLALAVGVLGGWLLRLSGPVAGA
jgi:methionine-rich copper-binding protein CopC